METFENPMGTHGFEFLEFATNNEEKLSQQFKSLGFTPIAKHRSKNVTLYRQGDINFIINSETNSMAPEFAKQHGASACAMGFRVQDAAIAYERAIELGAKPYESSTSFMELKIPAIYGIGGSIIYFVDRYGADKTIYDVDFIPIPGVDQHPKGVGLQHIDHVTHNVKRGNMDEWTGFYEKIFNFHEIRYFDIRGEATGLISRAMSSPCGKIRIPINESTDDKSQIEEFIDQFHGEGIQHIALSATDIFHSVETLRDNNITFMDVPETYYEILQERIPDHGEDIARLNKNYILVDGAPSKGEGTLLQIFTETMLGPVFFEIIQRKGNEGFGEGNFQALFDSIERDQIRRGVLDGPNK